MQEPSEEVDEWARRVIGAAIEVHRELGPGYLESIYEEALAIELDLRGIAYERQKPLPLRYKGRPLSKSHRLDFLVEGALVVELKAAAGIDPIHKAITISYLRATGLQLGLIINFNVILLKDGINRVVLN